MDTALPQKFPFILDRNLAKANCTENRVCMSCDTVVLAKNIKCHKQNFWWTHKNICSILTSQFIEEFPSNI